MSARTGNMATNIADVAIQAYERGLAAGYERARHETQTTLLQTAQLYAPVPRVDKCAAAAVGAAANGDGPGEAAAGSPPTQAARQRSNTVTRTVSTPPPPPGDDTGLELSMAALHMDDGSTGHSTPRSDAGSVSPRHDDRRDTRQGGSSSDTLPAACRWGDRAEPERTVYNDGATLRAAVAPPPGRTQGSTVTETVRRMSRPSSGMAYDNTRVASLSPKTLGALGIRVLPHVDVPFGYTTNEVSPNHDHMVAGLATLTDLDVVVLGAEIKIAATLPGTSAVVRGSIDLVGRAAGDDACLVPIEVKTSGQLTPNDWFKDVMRRTYIQQTMLYALMLEQRTGRRPRECIVLAGPSHGSKAAGPPRIYRYAVRYNPRLWLTAEINKHLALFRRFGGDEAAACDVLTFQYAGGGGGGTASE